MEIKINLLWLLVNIVNLYDNLIDYVKLMIKYYCILYIFGLVYCLLLIEWRVIFISRKILFM